MQESAAVVSTLLDRLHGGAADYTITVPEALLEQSRRTQRLFDIVMGAIAGISLLVGGIGIMNIMLATVLERTREIGVRRAMGARQVDIRNQFVMEAFAVTVTGGLLGIAMGLAIAKGVAAYAGWKTIVTLWSIVLSVGRLGRRSASSSASTPRCARPASTPSRRCATSRPRRGDDGKRTRLATAVALSVLASSGLPRAVAGREPFPGAVPAVSPPDVSRNTLGMRFVAIPGEPSTWGPPSDLARHRCTASRCRPSGWARPR